MHVDMDDLRQRLRDRTEELAATLLGEPNRAASSRHDMRFGRRGSLSVVTTGERRGLWCDHSSDEGGDLLRLVQRQLGYSFPAAVRWALDWLGDPDRHAPPPRYVTDAPPAVQHDTLSPWGRRLWDGALPITEESVAGRYLLGRRCGCLPGHHAVRWVPSLPHGPDEAFPALLALVTDAVDAERPINLHRTWLAPDGSGKAPVDRPRLLLKGHRKAGGVVRLSPDDEVVHGVGVAEGLETTLTVLAAGWAPAWCCLDAGNLRSFPVLDGIGALTVFGDFDRVDPRTGKRPGVEAANACAARWTAAGREARVLLPPTEGQDFNDWAVEADHG
jgi:putative DNA primase/helicase